MEQAPNPAEQYPTPGIYEHYKSTPEQPFRYLLLGTARHTETDELLAVYVPLYSQEGHGGLALQVRPLDMFMETVAIDGVEIPRFTYLGQER